MGHWTFEIVCSRGEAYASSTNNPYFSFQKARRHSADFLGWTAGQFCLFIIFKTYIHSELIIHAATPRKILIQTPHYKSGRWCCCAVYVAVTFVVNET